jgi:hypothetical protein
MGISKTFSLFVKLQIFTVVSELLDSNRISDSKNPTYDIISLSDYTRAILIYTTDGLLHQHTPHYVSTSVVAFKDTNFIISVKNSTLASNINLFCTAPKPWYFLYHFQFSVRRHTSYYVNLEDTRYTTLEIKFISFSPSINLTDRLAEIRYHLYNFQINPATYQTEELHKDYSEYSNQFAV